jgi:hypothetical protein
MEIEKPPSVILLDDPKHDIHYSSAKLARERIKLFLNRRAWQFIILGLVIFDATLVRNVPEPWQALSPRSQHSF